MVDLSAKPFNLDQDAISWVHADRGDRAREPRG